MSSVCSKMHFLKAQKPWDLHWTPVMAAGPDAAKAVQRHGLERA